MTCFAHNHIAAKNPFQLIFVWFLLGALSGAAAPALAAPPAVVSFLPQWQPQAQFAGYYVAYEKGFYREQGLDVRIMRGGPDRPPSEMLARGRADFGTMFLSTGVIQRARGEKLVCLAQVVQRSALMLVAKKASGINTPQDINGKKVGLWGEDFQGRARAFFRKYGLQVRVIPQSATLNLFLRGGVDVASAMWYNEYHLLLNTGLDPGELTTFRLADYGFNSPEDGIYCREDRVRDHPEVCRKFVRASLQGWQYAFEHPQEALDIVMKYVNAANVATDRVHQKWMLERMRDIIQPQESDVPPGILRQADYQRLSEEFQRDGLIPQIPPFSQFFLNCVTQNETFGTGN
jgi:NitT/TauT family transport system substrate-binding protein